MIERRNVYFLRPVGQQGPVKIGSSRMPMGRLKAVQIWSPLLLEMASFCPAHRNTEMFLHRHFLASHMHGEWFAWSEELQSLIDYVSNHSAMPDWVHAPENPKEFRAFIEKYPRGKTRPSYLVTAA